MTMKIWRSKEQPISGFIDQGINLTGELQFSGVFRIDGNFHGSIEGGDTLIVGNNAVIHADIRVREIEIHGHVFGNIDVGERAEIYSTGKIRGDIRTPSLVIHAGGILDGQSHMLMDSEPGSGHFHESTRILPRERDDQSRSFDRDSGQY